MVEMIECACGCGTLIPNRDKWHRKRKYVFGHANKGKKINEGKNNPFYGKKHSDDTKTKMSKSKKGKHTGEKHHNYGKKFSDEHRRKISESKMGVKHSEETKKKMSESRKGENNPSWLGGISFGKYCPKFNNAFREKIREMYDRKCFLCDKPEADNNGYKLSIHHVQYQKNCGCDDTLKCDYVPLCMGCHGKTSNGDRKYWENKILSMLHPDLNYNQIPNIIPLTNFFK